MKVSADGRCQICGNEVISSGGCPCQNSSLHLVDPEEIKKAAIKDFKEWLNTQKGLSICDYWMDEYLRGVKYG